MTSVCIVGKGHSIYRKGYGDRIDSHDYIIRSTYSDNWLEEGKKTEHYGKRTTHWVAGVVRAQELQIMDIVPEIETWLYYPFSKNNWPAILGRCYKYKPRNVQDDLQRLIPDAQITNPREVDGRIPTTALASIVLAIEYLKPSILTLAGLDFMFEDEPEFWDIGGRNGSMMMSVDQFKKWHSVPWEREVFDKHIAGINWRKIGDRHESK